MTTDGTTCAGNIDAIAANQPSISTKERVLAAASELLDREGRDAVSTRSVALAAGVQAPAIYRHFGDKRGLLDAVATRGFADYLATKRALAETDDPLDLLREGWDLHVAFGLSKPSFYLLIYSGPAPQSFAAAQQAEELLRTGFAPLAQTGRLRMSVDRAARLMQAAGVGLVLTLLGQPEDERDVEMSPLVRELVLSATVTEAGDAAAPDGIGPTVVALSHALRTGQDEALEALTEAERTLMSQWLDRVERADAERRLPPQP